MCVGKLKSKIGNENYRFFFVFVTFFGITGKSTAVWRIEEEEEEKEKEELNSLAIDFSAFVKYGMWLW
jgi:hypothetical protein